MYTVYALYSRNYNKIYIGQTEYIERRMLGHNNGLLPNYTKKYIPWQIIYTEVYSTRNEELKIEKSVGMYEINFNALTLASGIYFLKFRRAVLLKRKGWFCLDNLDKSFNFKYKIPFIEVFNYILNLKLCR